MNKGLLFLAIAATAALGSAQSKGATESGAAERNPPSSQTTSSQSIEETFDYFANNWNVIGLRDYTHGTRLSPNNELWLSGRTPIQIRVGRELKPLNRAQGKQATEGWLPVLTTTAYDGPARYDIAFWATPLPSSKDWQAAFNGPMEGENYLNWISIKATNTGADAIAAQATAEPNLDIQFPRHPGEQKEPKTSMTHTRKFNWSWNLAPGQSAEGVARYTFFPVDNPLQYDDAGAALWRQRTEDYWRGMMNRAARIQVPCRKATRALLAAHVCQLIANDHGDVRGGENFYDDFYVRDGAYQVMEVEEAGFADTASRSIELFLKRQKEDGQFESQKGEFDGNGQGIWALWQYHLITGDHAFLERVYPNLVRAAEWTCKTRRQAPADSPYAGLMPGTIADGECLWKGSWHITGYDLWNLRALLCVADAARVLAKSDDEKKWRSEAQEYRASIDAAVKRAGAPYFPASWEKAGTHWGNTETLWPTALFDRNDPRVEALIHHLRKEFGGGFIEGTLQWLGATHHEAIHPYLCAYTTMADLIRGNHEQVVEDFYWYLLHTTAANAFPEGIHYKRRYAWSETIPHVTGACNYAIMLRHMLVHEQGEELHLLSAVPDWWLGNGQEIRIEKLPTHFGEMGLIARGAANGIQVNFSKPARRAPSRIILHLPSNRPLSAPVEGVTVAMRNPQTVRWDFPTVVARYKQLTSSTVSLTTGKPVSCSLALPGMEASFANDGIIDTSSYWGTDVTKDPAAWWQVDLEQPTKVGRVIVIGYYGAQRSYGFTVEGSLEGKKWDMLADKRDNQAPSTKNGYTCEFAPCEIRYLRVTMQKCSANTGRHLVEVMAFEK